MISPWSARSGKYGLSAERDGADKAQPRGPPYGGLGPPAP